MGGFPPGFWAAGGGWGVLPADPWGLVGAGWDGGDPLPGFAVGACEGEVGAGEVDGLLVFGAGAGDEVDGWLGLGDEVEGWLVLGAAAGGDAVDGWLVPGGEGDALDVVGDAGLAAGSAGLFAASRAGVLLGEAPAAAGAAVVEVVAGLSLGAGAPEPAAPGCGVFDSRSLRRFSRSRPFLASSM